MAHSAPPPYRGAVRGLTPRQTPPPQRRRKASSGLELGQPLDRLLRERVVLFLAVVFLRADERFGEAFAEAVDFARARVAVPFPFPFERERVFCSSACSRCCCCVRSIFERPMTFPSGSAKSAETTFPPASTGPMPLRPPRRSAFASVAAGSSVST